MMKKRVAEVLASRGALSWQCLLPRRGPGRLGTALL